MATAQVKLNAVLPSATAKAKTQVGKSDTSFSDILSKENNVTTAKSSIKESKTDIASGKYSKEVDKVQTGSTDSQTVNKSGDRTDTGKNDIVYKAKDSTYQADKDAVKRIFTEEPEDDGEAQDENVKALMAVLAGMIADISRKTGADEATIKDFIATNNLTSENLLDINSWKSFVTEVNGLNDISAILTNDEAFKTLGDISEIINAHLTEMGQTTTGMTEGVADGKKTEEGLPESEKKDILSLGEILAKMFDKPKKEELVVTRKEAEVTETIEVDAEEPLVISSLMMDMNDAGAANTRSGFEQNNRNSGGDRQNTSVEVTGVSSQNLFDNIAANVQKLEGTGSLPEGTTARAILEQVTNQIKSLHAPDKTSIEIMLTPETLGKVAINVTSRRGVLQAEFRVETAEAKSALESQIANLKLNFENQGLKVDSVSVMISENGIGRDNQRKNTGEEGGRGNKRNRNFKLDVEEGLEDVSVLQEEAITAYTDNGTGNNINLGA